MDKAETIKEVLDDLQKLPLQLTGKSNTYQQLQQEIAARINYLITNNFSLLISLLYRLDISEKKLRQLLGEPAKTTAGDIIAEMIIERQLQKIASRKAFKSNLSDISGEEKW
jgi:lipopolysaccharide assembly outer membrane protein LptD (OstA)